MGDSIKLLSLQTLLALRSQWDYAENECGPGSNGLDDANRLGLATCVVLELLLGRPATPDEVMSCVPASAIDIAGRES